MFGEDLRSKISKRKKRVGSTDKASLSNFIKIFGSTEGGSEKPIRALWLDHGRSPV
jgi:two-component SAPR family response regulator